MHTVPSVYVNISDNGGAPVVGQPYTLSCRVSGEEKLDPNVTYQWIQNNGTVMELVNETNNSANLSFSPLHLSNSGDYICMVDVSSMYFDGTIMAISNSFSIHLQGKSDHNFKPLHVILIILWPIQPHLHLSS